jgi:hypothetical protein
LESYTDALKQAPESWKKYKESFSAENPGYDHKAVLNWEKQERERKIAAGLIAPPKARSRGAKGGRQGGGGKGKGGEASSKEGGGDNSDSLKASHKKETLGVDSDDEYDVVIRTVTTKKRKRSGSSSVESSSSTEEPPKNKRKRSTPVKKVPTTHDLDVPPLTKKSPGKPIPLPASSIKRKSQGTGKAGVKRQRAPPQLKETSANGHSSQSLAQETEEDFLQEDEGEEGEGSEEGEVVMNGGGGAQYADDVLF